MSGALFTGLSYGVGFADEQYMKELAQRKGGIVSKIRLGCDNGFQKISS